jgi:aminopeptidase-like protein
MESKEVMENEKLANLMHHWCKKLYPITRSITGPGVRSTLDFLGEQLQGKLNVHEILSGTKAFDWTVPNEWIIRDAWVEDEQGNRIIDFQTHNLHVVGYSEPVNQWLDLDELQEHLYSLPEQPDAIPYITSYYQRRWGFCLTHNQRQQLKPGRYRVVVDADLKPGVLNYGELIIPGDSDREVLLSTYVCHPSMANNELSGPVVTTAIAQWLQSLPRRRYTYRVVFIPETIGSLVYLSRHLEHLKRQVIAGFNVTCIGDERAYSYLPSRAGDSLSDLAAKHVLHHFDPGFVRYSWLDRGSDERQYCAPGIDLPIASIMRSKYGAYPEYHTSLDDLNLVTPAGLEGGYWALRRALEVIESNVVPAPTVLGEPQLGKRGLYPNISMKGSTSSTKILMDLLTYCDGERTLLEIAELIGQPTWELLPLLDQLAEHELVIIYPDL